MQWVTTDSHHRLGVAANWLDGDFAADAPNRKWAGDITNIWTSEGWLYLAVIMDLLSRRVVGWAVSDRMAEGRRSQQGSGDQGIGHGGAPAPGRRPSPLAALNCVSGRGSQYYSYDDQKELQAYGLCPSMSGKDNCYDNGSVETLFKSLKVELIWRQSWSARRQAEAAILSVHKWLLQHPPSAFILGRHQPARLRN